jgi:hypothetical protein
MRSQLFAGAALAAVLTVAVALAGAFTKSPAPASAAPAQAVASAAQPCGSGADCCPECLACCADDGCCPECLACCIAMGCDPSGCFPALARAKAEAPKQAEESSAQAPEKGQDCCADGCCK